MSFAKAEAQQINLDSLLYKTIELFNQKKYEQVIENATKAIEIAPDYLDYYLFLGKAQQEKDEIAKARINFAYIIENDTNYKDAFTALINLELNQENYSEALAVSEKAIASHQEEVQFYFKKLAALSGLGDRQTEYDYVKQLILKYPENDDLRRRLRILELQFNFDLAGLSYTYTTFDRSGIGPWHLGSAQYNRQREWGSLSGRINYADRLADGSSIADGVQYELESYFFSGKNSYTYLGAAYSSDQVFPTWRLGASYFQNLGKGWEADIGMRYNKVFDDREFYTAAAGVSKYLGNYWIYLRAFLQNEDDKYYPAFVLTNRYFLNTRFDYLSLVLGFGTSPDERATLGQFENRVSTESYRINAGYFRFLNDRYLIGVQLGYNYQEYLPGFFQNEIELLFSLQYKLGKNGFKK